MKIKLDENLPHQLAPALEKIGHNVDTLQHESLVGHPDEEIWAAPQQESRFLITQDMDFSDVRKFSPGSHSGLLPGAQGSLFEPGERPSLGGGLDGES